VAVVDPDKTLAEFCDRAGLLPARTAAELVASAANSLDAIHRRGETHGHLGPWSLLRVGEREARVADLDHRRSLAASGAIGALDPTEASYLAPEQVRGARPDARSDLFSLGAVLHHLLTGAPPFPGDTTSSILYRIVHEPPQDAGARVPAALRTCLDRALAKRPEERFASAAEMARALDAAAAHLAAQRDRASAAMPEVPRWTPGAEALPGSSVVHPLRKPRMPRRMAWIAGAGILLALAGAAWLELGRGAPGASRARWLETRVRVEPAEAAVTLDGIPLDLARTGGVVRFEEGTRRPLLAASHGCRKVERRLAAEDAGREIAIRLDPSHLKHRIDAGVTAAEVVLDGRVAGRAPLEVDLDLCRENRLELRAPGFRATPVVLAAGASPAEASRQLDALDLVEVPRGRLRLPASKIDLTYTLDGDRLDPAIEVWELEEGRHELRYANGFHFLDGTLDLQIRGGETTVPRLELPPMSTLVVQAFPPNCRAWVRRPGGTWSSLGETPAERSVAVGSYEVKVEYRPTGEIRLERVKVVRGKTPPVRVAFGSGGA
jgi:hypothetical protein